MRTSIVWSFVCVAALSLTGCAATSNDAPNQAVAPVATASATQLLSELGLSTNDAVTLVEGLEALPVNDRPNGLTVQVLPSSVVLQPGTPAEESLPLAGDEFYLSLAPYETQTHPCEFHVPTSCLGEMQGAEIQLRITDAETGEVVRDEVTSTEDNGFIGVWLPREREYRVQVTADGRTGERTVRTGSTDPTCITTLQLKA
ncbi:CueP family metal-binding protein [Leucobacter sp. HY1908]